MIDLVKFGMKQVVSKAVMLSVWMTTYAAGLVGPTGTRRAPVLVRGRPVKAKKAGMMKSALSELNTYMVVYLKPKPGETSDFTMEGLSQHYARASEECADKLPLATYNTLLRVYGSAGDTRGCLDVLRDMGNAGLHPTEASYSQIVSAHVENGEVDAALEAIETMISKSIPLRLRTFAPVVRALAEAPETAVQAARLCRDMLHRHKVEPSEELYALVLKGITAAAAPPTDEKDVKALVGDLLTDLERTVDSVPKEWLEVVAGALQGPADSPFGAEWFELGHEDDTCPCCKAIVKSGGFDQRARRKFASRLYDVAGSLEDDDSQPVERRQRATEHKERQQRALRAFGGWLEAHPWRFTAVVDAPNVCYYNQNFAGGKFDIAQLRAVVEALEAWGHVVLLCIPERYCEPVVPNHARASSSKNPHNNNNNNTIVSSRPPRRPPKNKAAVGGILKNGAWTRKKGNVASKHYVMLPDEKATLAHWFDRGMVYSVPRGCHDDLYWMLATVLGDPGIVAVTNDKARDHWHKLLGERDYRRWSDVYIAQFDIERFESEGDADDVVKATIQMPPAVNRIIHRTAVSAGQTTWHVPEPEGSRRWLCARVDVPNRRTEESTDDVDEPHVVQVKERRARMTQPIEPPPTVSS